MISISIQIGNDRGYKDNPHYYQRGHLARRKSLSWGTSAEAISDAKLAERESDYYTNIAPQERRMHVAWGKVEDWMLELSEAPSMERRACVFQGPVFTYEDPEVIVTEGYEPVKIPAGYWKIMALRRGEDLRAAGFLIWQRDYATPEPLKFAPVLEQVRLTTIEVLTGLSFRSLRGADAMIFSTEQRRLERLTTLQRNENPTVFGRARNFAMTTVPAWAKSVLSARKPNNSPIIEGPEDIMI